MGVEEEAQENARCVRLAQGSALEMLIFPCVVLGFARRYFVLYQSGLLSYSFEPGKPSRDQIELPHAAISTARGQKDIHIDSNNATFHIKCLNTEDFDEWMVSFRYLAWLISRSVNSHSRHRQFIAPPADARSLGRRSSVGRGMSRLGQAGKTGAMVEEMGIVSSLFKLLNKPHSNRGS